MLCAILRNSFAAFGFGQCAVGVVDADGLFCSYPCRNVRVHLVMTTDNDVFASFGAMAVRRDAKLFAWRGAEVANQVVTRVKLLDVRRAGAAFVDGMFPYVKVLCTDAAIRQAIFTSPLSLALDVGYLARLPVATVHLLKVAACMSSVPPLFVSSTKSRKPGLKKVAVVLDRAIKLMAESPA